MQREDTSVSTARLAELHAVPGSTQGILDAIFGPRLRVVFNAARTVAKDIPSRITTLHRIKKMKPDEEFQKERKTTRMSFAFTERERTLFTHKFLEMTANRDKDPTTAGTAIPPNYMTREEFAECWFAARDFEASNETLDTVESLFASEKYIDCVEFTGACALDIEETSRVAFAVSFVKEERRTYEGLVELLYYIPFLVLLSIIVITFRSLPTGFQVHEGIAKNMFDRRFTESCSGLECTERAQRPLTFREVTEKAYFYEWVRRNVIPTIWTGADTESGDIEVNYRLLPIGALRFQQYRVDENTELSNAQYNRIFVNTDPSPTEKSFIQSKYPRTAETLKVFPSGPDSNYKNDWSHSDFGFDALNATPTVPLYIKSGFRYSYLRDCGSFTRGFLQNYRCDGHLLDLPLNLTKADAIKAVDLMEQMNWVDQGSRYVGLRFIFFNKDYQIFDRFVAGYEVAPGGHWLRLLRSNPFRFFTLSQQSNLWIGFFIFFIAWLAWNIVSFFVGLWDSVRESARALGRPLNSVFDAGYGLGFLRFVFVVLIGRAIPKTYVKDPWLVIDTVNYACFIIVWLWRARSWSQFNQFSTYNNNAYPDDLESYVSQNAEIDYLESANIVLSYLRLLKNLRVFPILRLIFKSLASASFDLIGMAFTAFILIVAFALSGFVAYGPVVPDFSSATYSLVAILRFVIGDYDYEIWESAKVVMSPFYFAMLQILLVIIVLEFITAIIADTFGDMSKEQYKADYIRHVIENDLKSILTANVIDSPTRNPIAMEFIGFGKTLYAYARYLYRFCRHYLTGCDGKCAKLCKCCTCCKTHCEGKCTCCNEDDDLSGLSDDERKKRKKQELYEDPPVDSALYLLELAERKPQSLHHAIEKLIIRSYLDNDEIAAEALFLLYEMLFELESRDDVQDRNTRQLAFTLAASHCKTENLTAHLSAAPRNLVSALISRINPNNYPFLVAVGVHLPHAVSRLPRVSRFVALFEAHATWESTARNCSIFQYETSRSLRILDNLTSIGEVMAKQYEGGDDDDDDDSNDGGAHAFANNRGITAATPAHQSNSALGANQNIPSSPAVNVSSPSLSALSQAVSKGKLTSVNNLNGGGLLSQSGGMGGRTPTTTGAGAAAGGGAGVASSTECKQAESGAMEFDTQNSFRVKAAFSGIPNEKIMKLFDGWKKLKTKERIERIAQYRQDWMDERKKWEHEGVADSMDLDVEGEIIFRDIGAPAAPIIDPSSSAQQQAPVVTKVATTTTTLAANPNATLTFGGSSQEMFPLGHTSSGMHDDAFEVVQHNPRTDKNYDVVAFFNAVYTLKMPENGLTHLQNMYQECSRRIMHQGWTDRKKGEFRKYLIEEILEQRYSMTKEEKATRKQDRLAKKKQSASPSPSPDASSAGAATAPKSSVPTAPVPAAATTAPASSTSILTAIVNIDINMKRQLRKLGASTAKLLGFGSGSLADSASLAASGSGPLDEVGDLDDDPDPECVYISLRAFGKIWKKIVGGPLSSHMEGKFIELSHMMQGENAEVKIDAKRFLDYCVVNPDAHRHTTIQSSYYTVQHALLYNTVQLLLYIPFVVTFTLLLLLSQNNLGTFTSVTVREYLSRPFKSPEMRPFNRISNSDQWRNWVDQNVFDQFLSNVDGDPTLNFTGGSLLVGGIRIRQFRTESVQDCGFPDPGILPLQLNNKFYQDRKATFFNTYCVPRWNIGFEQKSNLLVNDSSLTTSEARAAFVYTPCTSISRQSGYTGYFSNCDGYILFIPNSKSRSSATAILDEVMPLWLDVNTRALVVDFFVYNFDDDLFVRTMVLAETSTGGGWQLHIRQDPFRLFSFSPIGANSRTWIIVMSFFIVSYFATVGSFGFRTYEQYKFLKRKHSCSRPTALWMAMTESAWWFVELIIYGLIAASLCTRFYFMSASNSYVALYKQSYPEDLISFAEAAYALSLIDAVNTFFVYVRIFFFVRLNSNLNVLPKTIERAAGYMLSILVISVIVLIAFGLAGHVVYGPTVLSMSTASDALRTLALTIFEQSDFENWLASKPIWTVIYFALFTFVCVQILFNMITSVLARAYSDAKDERFNAQELDHVNSVDATILGVKALVPYTFANVLITEFKYRCALLYRFFRTKCCPIPGIERANQVDMLKNPYTFYQFMDETTSLFEFGSPRQAGVAAGNLLVCMDILAEESQDELELQKRWSIAVRNSPAEQIVFGIERQSVLDYLGNNLPKGQFNRVYFWCYKMPVTFLGLSPKEAISKLLESHVVWASTAQKYRDLEGDETFEVKDAEERDEKLGEVVGRLTKAAETVMKHYRKPTAF